MQRHRMRSVTRATAMLACAALLVAAAGCASQKVVDRDLRARRGYVYYLDGAGGGTLLSNWGVGVRQGLRDAGYDGTGEMFTWETGLGVAADHQSSVAYKKARAKQLAAKIIEYHKEHPDAPISIIGLSAGTAVAVYTLEALPPDVIIEDVVMLSGSLSADYDLTDALRRVRDRMFIFTSQRDNVLQLLVPVGGTADRKPGFVGTLGIDGARMPKGASAETVNLYGKIVQIPWNPEFGRLGNAGGHTDSVSPGFVREVVAPLIMTTSTKAIAMPASGDMVANPDYTRWAGQKPGSWALLRGEQQIDGRTQRIMVRTTLVAANDQRLVVDREFKDERGRDAGTPGPRRIFVPAKIKPSDHPLTAPGSTVEQLPPRSFTVKGKALTVPGRRVEAMGHFEAWGDDAQGEIFSSAEVPGGLLALDLRTRIEGHMGEFKGELADYFVAK